MDALARGSLIARPVEAALPAPATPGGAAQTAIRSGLTDFCWDRVTSIELDGEEDVYDLTVDGLHNFVADDLVVHNSIEQDADLVMFIYREEYYDRETEREGMADLIVAKHRNGGLGTVELTFQKEYPRFMSYVSEDRYGP